MAYELCTTSAQQTSNAATISALVLKCKKAKWDIRERERIRRRGDLLSDLEAMLETEFKRDTDEIEARIENGEVSRVEGQEEKQERKIEFEKKRDDLRTAFAISDPEHQQKREVPDYLIDGITFGESLSDELNADADSLQKSCMIPSSPRMEGVMSARHSLSI